MRDTLTQAASGDRVAPNGPRGTRDLRRTLAPLLATTLLLVAAGCGGGSHPGGTSAARTPVEIETVVLDSATTGALILPARIKAREEVMITARAAGRLTRLPAREGESVHAGDLVAIFDAPESRRALNAAQQELDAAQLGYEVARRQAARMDSLFSAGLAASHDREVAASAGRSAEARLESARATLEQLDATLAMRAPFDGVVARRFVDAGADVAAGAPILELRSTGGTEIVVPIPEAALPALDHARFAYQIDTGEWRNARLDRVEGMTDFSTRTRTARLRPEGGPMPEAGAFARVRIESAELPDPPLPLLPASSITRRGALTGAFVVDSDHVELRWLKLGRDQGDAVEVLSGLFPGERVAKDAAGLSDGVPVRVRP